MRSADLLGLITEFVTLQADGNYAEPDSGCCCFLGRMRPLPAAENEAFKSLVHLASDNAHETAEIYFTSCPPPLQTAGREITPFFARWVKHDILAKDSSADFNAKIGEEQERLSALIAAHVEAFRARPWTPYNIDASPNMPALNNITRELKIHIAPLVNFKRIKTASGDTSITAVDRAIVEKFIIQAPDGYVDTPPSIRVLPVHERISRDGRGSMREFPTDRIGAFHLTRAIGSTLDDLVSFRIDRVICSLPSPISALRGREIFENPDAASARPTLTSGLRG